MKNRREQDERFDPLAPVGPVGGGDPPDEIPNDPNVIDAQPDRGRDDPLTVLVERATRPPADLKLDWGRLHADLTREGLGRRREQQPFSRTTEGRRASPARLRLRLWWVGAAAAAAVLLTVSLLPLHRPDGTSTRHVAGQPVEPPKVDNAVSPGGPDRSADVVPKIYDTVASAEPPTIVVGLTPDAARRLVRRQDRDMVVVFPRRSGGAMLTAAGPAEPAGPLVLTDRAPLGGTPYGRQPVDFDSNEAVYLSN